MEKVSTMSEAMKLAAAVRDRGGKGASRAVRLTGRVPAVIYGNKTSATMIHVPLKELTKLLHTGHFMNSVVELEVDGAGRAHPAARRPVPSGQRPADPRRLPAPGRRRDDRRRRAGPLRRRGPVAGHEARRHAQRRPPRDRADLPVGRHPRPDRHQPRRPRHRRFGPHLGGQAARRRDADDHRPRLHHRLAWSRRRRCSRPMPPPTRRSRPLPPPSRPPPRRNRTAGAGEVQIFAGLGNPGAAHALQRHNVGFMAADAIHARVDGSTRGGRASRAGRRGAHRRREGAAAQARDLHERQRARRSARRCASTSSAPTR